MIWVPFIFYSLVSFVRHLHSINQSINMVVVVALHDAPAKMPPPVKSILSKILKVVIYHATSPLENGPLFFYIAVLSGKFVTSIRGGEEWWFQALAAVVALFTLWLVQERISIISTRMVDPLVATTKLAARPSRGVPSRKNEQRMSTKNENTKTTTPSSSLLAKRSSSSSSSASGLVPTASFSSSNKKDPLKEKAIKFIADKYFVRTSPFYEKTKTTIINDDPLAAAERALVARKYKLEDTSVLIENMLAWRADNKVDSIFTLPVPPHTLRVIRTYMSDGFFGVDLEGYPLYWSRVGVTNLGKLKQEVGLEVLLHYHIQAFEYNQRVYYNEISAKSGFTVYQSTCVLDLKGFGSHSVGGGFLDVMKGIASVDADNYYECFHRVLILNAPMFFRIFWRSVSALLHEDTRRKFIVLDDYRALWKHIDKRTIPRAFGGEYDGEDAFCTAESPTNAHIERFDAFIASQQRGENDDQPVVTTHFASTQPLQQTNGIGSRSSSSSRRSLVVSAEAQRNQAKDDSSVRPMLVRERSTSF